MPAASVRRIQDAVHGLMEFRGLEGSLIDILRAREVQRLRRIRQLGLGHLVFPAAEHSRLAHCLGAAHVAVRFARRLEQASRESLSELFRADEEARRDLALAAICHDLGHGPLSHVFERTVIGNFDPGAWESTLGVSDLGLPSDLKWHELVGQGILNWSDSEVHQLLEQIESGTSERVRRMLIGEHYVPYLPRLLAGDIDVDRCDFILRDTYQTGVAYGRFDLDWLISTAAVGYHEGRLVVGFDYRKAPRVVEQFLVARRALYDTVYQHKTVRSAEGMVGLLLQRLKEVVESSGWFFEDERLFRGYEKAFASEPLSPDEVLGLDDHSLWTLILYIADQPPDEGDPTVRDLATRLVERRLYKRVNVSPKRLSAFLGREGRESLYPIVENAGFQNPRYYVLVDENEFLMLGDDPNYEAYLVDQDAGQGPAPAKRARDHPILASYYDGPDPEVATNLYVPEEALEDVLEVVGGGIA